MKTLLKIVATMLMALVIFSAGAGSGFALRDYVRNDQPTDGASQEFSLYWEVWNRVENQFYGGIPEEANPTYGAIRGSLAALDDPYTIFLEPEPAAKEKAQLEGQFGGIGAYVQQNEAGQIVLNPMREQPAEQAGLLPGDILVAIDGKEVLPEMTIDEVVTIIRGEIGTEVVLSVLREGTEGSIDIAITRAIIETPSADWRLLEEDPTIGYIRLSSFTERSSAEMADAFAELTEQGAESFIFDLRGNGGGLLDAAVDVASQFLEDGIVVTEDRQNEGERVYEVESGGEKVLERPVVVLVNGGTASASEIVAGALQDYDRATLVGEKTFGKGSVQLIYELSDKSRLHVTVAKWFTPDGHVIDGTGLQPDVEVLFTEEDHANGNDPQFQRAISFLQNKEYAGYQK